MPRVRRSTGLEKKSDREDFHFGYDVNSADRGSMTMTDRECLWAGVTRRENGASSTAHGIALKMMKPYLLAYIISGAAGVGSSLWPEKEKTWLSTTMKTAWTEVTTRLQKDKVNKGYRWADVPTPYEARKVYMETA